MLDAWRERRKYDMVVQGRGKLITLGNCVLISGQHYDLLEVNDHDLKT